MHGERELSQHGVKSQAGGLGWTLALSWRWRDLRTTILLPAPGDRFSEQIRARHITRICEPQFCYQHLLADFPNKFGHGICRLQCCLWAAHRSMSHAFRPGLGTTPDKSILYWLRRCRGTSRRQAVRRSRSGPPAL